MSSLAAHQATKKLTGYIYSKGLRLRIRISQRIGVCAILKKWQLLRISRVLEVDPTVLAGSDALLALRE